MPHDYRALAIRWLEENWNTRNDGIVASHRPVDVTGTTWSKFDQNGRILEGHDTRNRGAALAALA